MTRRVVVVGADAAGMSAAHQALRVAKTRGEALEVVALEATDHTSYSACGLPYWIAGDVAGASDLVARTPEEHRARGVDLRTGATVTAVDTAARTVGHVDRSGATTELAYDELVLATGAGPVVPDWARDGDGTTYAGIGPVTNLDEGAAWLDRLERTGTRRVVVAGGSYIGLEMAEAALRRGREVTVVTRSRVMSNLDADVSDRIVTGLREAGVRVVEGSEVTGLTTEDGRVRSVESTAGSFACDLLVLALGVRPALEFLEGAGLETGESGGLRPDPRGAVAPGVWAAGDCCEVRHRLSDRWVHLPLGTHANKLGRVVGENLAGGDLSFDGVLGTAITRFVQDGVHLEVARTGLSTQEATDAGIDVVSLVTEGTTASGYMPEAAPITVKILGERGTRRLLGAQVVGGPGAGKRIDTVAACLWGGMRVDDLAWMDLSYAPPFATAWEIVSLAARRLAERL